MSLAKVIDGAVGLAAVVIMVVLVKTLWLPPAVKEPGAAREGVVSSDHTYPQLTAERTTVVLIASAKCRYCEASLPFYKTLADQSRTERNFDVAVLVSQKETSDELQTFFAAGGVRDVRWVEGALPPSVNAVPAVVVLDSSGKVLASWLGKLSGTQERALVKLLVSSD